MIEAVPLFGAAGNSPAALDRQIKQYDQILKSYQQQLEQQKKQKVEDIVQQMKGYSSQTLRATKVSLNFDSDSLYPSWQHGMELLANIWGSEESLEGMNAFMEKRPADFHQFRERNKAALDSYLDDFYHDRNQSEASRAARP